MYKVNAFWIKSLSSQRTLNSFCPQLKMTPTWPVFFKKKFSERDSYSHKWVILTRCYLLLFLPSKWKTVGIQAFARKREKTLSILCVITEELLLVFFFSTFPFFLPPPSSCCLFLFFAICRSCCKRNQAAARLMMGKKWTIFSTSTTALIRRWPTNHCWNERPTIIYTSISIYTTLLLYKRRKRMMAFKQNEIGICQGHTQGHHT